MTSRTFSFTVATPPQGGTYAGYSPTIYAAPAALGNGSGSSEANAALWSVAFASATAGTTIGMLPGVYIGTPANVRYRAIFRMQGVGTAAQPIRVVCKYPAALNQGSSSLWTELRSNNTSVFDPALTAETPYVEYNGFYIDWTHVPPRPSSGVTCLNNSNGTFRNMLYDQRAADDSDNRNSIYGENANNCAIINCVFRNDPGGNHNTACIDTYNCKTLLIEHNTFTNVNLPIFLKGASTNATGNSATIRYNLCTGARRGFMELLTCDTSGPVDVYQNLAVGGFRAFVFDNSISLPLTNVRVNANTFVDMTEAGGLLVEHGATYTGCEFKDNVVQLAGGYAHSTNTGVGFPTSLTSNYNLFYRASGAVTFNNNGSVTTLSGWQSAMSKDTNSTEGNPGFVGGGDYRRLGADTSSSLGGKRGCYITGSEIMGIVTV
jgi:hypothetical protein